MKGKKSSAVAASGAVALIFLILGFQIAIFSGNVFRFRQEAADARADEAPADEEAPAGARAAADLPRRIMLTPLWPLVLFLERR